eukprot:COSAG02_NODE_948_length_15709_cov_67.728700_10_plen_76_part_00
MSRLDLFWLNSAKNSNSDPFLAFWPFWGPFLAFYRLNRTSVLHLPIALTKIELIPIFHVVECDREMAFDSFLSPA